MWQIEPVLSFWGYQKHWWSTNGILKIAEISAILWMYYYEYTYLWVLCMISTAHKFAKQGDWTTKSSCVPVGRSSSARYSLRVVANSENKKWEILGNNKNTYHYMYLLLWLIYYCCDNGKPLGPYSGTQQQNPGTHLGHLRLKTDSKDDRPAGGVETNRHTFAHWQFAHTNMHGTCECAESHHYIYIYIYHYISLYLIIYHYTSLYIIIYVSLSIILYHYIYHYISFYISLYI